MSQDGRKSIQLLRREEGGNEANSVPVPKQQSKEVAITKIYPLPAENPDGVVAETPVVHKLNGKTVGFINRTYKNALFHKSVQRGQKLFSKQGQHKECFCTPLAIFNLFFCFHENRCR